MLCHKCCYLRGFFQWYDLKIFPDGYIQFHNEIYQVLFNHQLLGTKLFFLYYKQPFKGYCVITFWHKWNCSYEWNCRSKTFDKYCQIAFLKRPSNFIFSDYLCVIISLHYQKYLIISKFHFLPFWWMQIYYHYFTFSGY